MSDIYVDKLAYVTCDTAKSYSKIISQFILYSPGVDHADLKPFLAFKFNLPIKVGTLHWCAKKMAPVQKKWHPLQKKWHLLQKKCHPLQKKWHPLKKSNSHNIKLYDFNLNMIHFILIFYNK